MPKLSQLFVEIRNDLARSVLKIVPPHAVEDIVQEAYVRLCQIDEESVRHPRSYLYQAVHNLALDHVKRAGNRLASDVEADELQTTSEDPTLNAAMIDEQFAHFCNAVRQLPLQCRRVFVLKKVYSYSQREIAEKLHISESTVEKHIALGIRRCRDYMRNSGSQSDLQNNSKMPSQPRLEVGKES